MNKDKNIGVKDTGKAMDPLAKEVAANHRRHIGMDKRRPRQGRLPLGLVRGRVLACFFEYVAFSRIPHSDAQFLQFSDDSAKCPSQILARNTQDKPSGGLGNTRPTEGGEAVAFSPLSNPLSIRGWKRHVRHISDIMLNRFTNTKELGLLGGLGHDRCGIDPRTKDSNPRFRQLKLRIVPRTKPLSGERRDSKLPGPSRVLS